MPDEAQEARPPADLRASLLPDPRVVWMVFRRNIWIFLAVFAAVVGTAAAWTLTQTPIYSASASLLIEPAGSDVINVKAVTPDLAAKSDIIDTQVRLISSPEITRRAADAYARLRPSDPRSAAAARHELAATMAGIVSVHRSGLTLVIDIQAESPEPQFAADTANLFASEYIAAQRDAKVGANQHASAWLTTRTEDLRAASSQADAALQQYKIRNGLLSANGATNAEQEVSTLNTQIAAAKAELAEKSGRLNAARAQLRAGGQGADVGAALGSGTIGTLRQSEANASAEVAQLEARYGPLHPDLVKAKSQLAELRIQIQKEIDRILSNLEADVQVASSRLGSLQSSQVRANGELAGNNSAAVGLMELQRRADAAKAIYETFLNRLRETSAQQGLQQADARIAAAAEVPSSPDFPNHKLAAAAGVGGGIMLGLIAIALAEYLKGGVRTKSDVERRLRVRYAGAVPTLQSTLGRMRATEPPEDYIVSHPLSAFAESFRAIQAFLMLGGGRTPGARVVAIASALPQEGKTTTSACLARTAALGGARTVLVDCDLRRRGSSELLIKGQHAGLYEYMRGEVSLEEALVLDEPSGAWVLGTAFPQQDARDPLTPNNMMRLLGELRSRFDVVILDTAPVLGVADARAVSASADRVLVISRWAKTSVSAVEAAIDVLLDAGAKISGLALTQVDITRYASTGQTDAYGYQKKFRGYYTN
ncbi:GumC family protein [Sphingomonas sp. S2-65]|uniref:GumC family protein n=1 Tax=Sphingomonas sp. S2-65 TaxID=2903960 RepID=UPI001F17597A|nr:polysaccharide biosynthesis tyrosine autokinase [Sphingomonas sp. S2-65]UYY57063.1 polysaccharide biosynthesis tyrosine autokinase [Sphingomonas sp. S2-65]